MKTGIGYVNRSYLEERNFLSAPLSRYDYRPAPNLMRRVADVCEALGRRFPRLRPRTTRPWYQFLHCSLSSPGVRLLHLFNTVSLTHLPWVVTYETALPRWNEQSWFGMRLLAGRRCRKIIAMSQCAFDTQVAILDRFPSLRDAIRGKLCVLHPPQPLLVGGYPDKRLCPDRIVFTLIGHEFFRKGGMEVLRATDRLLREGLPIRLNIVSLLEIGDYASRSTEADRAEARTLIAAHPEHIRHFPRLSAAEVQALLRDSHVGLLPTWADTYGFSVLEAQAAACPVITTNIRALPEVNNDAVGWLIPVPGTATGNAVLTTEADRNRLSEVLNEHLYAIMKQICRNPGCVQEKGSLALERVRQRHDPARHAAILESIYEEALCRT
jgi:glycosyltransferase involved in cell wall biosynthesis